MRFTSIEAKKLVANTRAQLQREAQQAAEQAASINPEVEPKSQPNEDDQLMQRSNTQSSTTTQADVLVPNTEGNTITLLSQMLSQVSLNTCAFTVS
jgi:hypothetical protein